MFGVVVALRYLLRRLQRHLKWPGILAFLKPDKLASYFSRYAPTACF